MIGVLTGMTSDAGKDMIVVQTSGGVGYLVTVSDAVKNAVLSQKESTLFTHTAIQKDTMKLFGFLDQEVYSTFLLLLTVSGIGPKKALSILSTVPPQPLIAAIKKEDVDTLVSFGVGRKQAQRIILDLQKSTEVLDDSSGITSDVITALIALGYDRKEIAETFRDVTLSGETVEQQIQEALKHMRRP
ncbi:MAG: Holliday junction branch migration protein RuvA [Candidatus Kaiserbacteria bacterium]|nr:Holliday junction branch migration protein RuvA [Candidatus Kaiserbacteria bacterium]